MQVKRWILPTVAFLFAAALLYSALFAHAEQKSGETLPVSYLQEEEEDGQAIFPALCVDAVNAVSIVTPQTAFDLRRKDQSTVSVNGQRGDHEVFSTLLDQIADMCFVPTEPFAVQQAPLLTLEISQQGKAYSAAFYADEDAQENSKIILYREGTPVYGRTDGWRIGTLMLACEGVRIQDANGKETPFK